MLIGKVLRNYEGIRTLRPLRLPKLLHAKAPRQVGGEELFELQGKIGCGGRI